MLEDIILDYYDDLMTPYYSSREYACSQKAIDLKIESLQQSLTTAQKAALIELLNMMSDDYARTAMVAFVTGVRTEGKLPDQPPS